MWFVVKTQCRVQIGVNLTHCTMLLNSFVQSVKWEPRERWVNKSHWWTLNFFRPFIPFDYETFDKPREGQTIRELEDGKPLHNIPRLHKTSNFHFACSRQNSLSPSFWVPPPQKNLVRAISPNNMKFTDVTQSIQNCLSHQSLWKSRKIASRWRIRLLCAFSLHLA